MGERWGISIVERSLLESLKTVWEGELDPADLHRIDLALRAFIVSHVLTLSIVSDPSEIPGSPEAATRERLDWTEPFGDHLLDYEFTHPGDPHAMKVLDGGERGFLERLVHSKLGDAARSALPAWLKLEGEAYAYLDAWYAGHPPERCREAADRMLYHEDNMQRMAGAESLSNHSAFGGSPSVHAQYLVGAHRAGFIVFGASPIAQICQEHIFAEWPNELFETVGANYQTIARSIRAPGVAVELPPLLGILLSRAKTRDAVPEALRDLRAEYAGVRRELWTMLETMWNAPRFDEQVRIAKKLKTAAAAVVSNAFPESLDVFEVALGIAQLTPGGIVQSVRAVRTRDAPNASVSAVSFAKKLSADLRSLENGRILLRRHLTSAELRNFGIA